MGSVTRRDPPPLSWSNSGDVAHRSHRIKTFGAAGRYRRTLLVLLIGCISVSAVACAEEEVVECFSRLSGDRYCVKIPESTSCALELSSNKVGCVDREGNTTYPERFNFDDGNIWLPND